MKKNSIGFLITFLLLVSSISIAASDSTSISKRISSISTQGENLIISFKPDFINTQNCPNANENQVIINSADTSGKSMMTTVFFAAAAGKKVGFDLNGCNTYPQVTHLHVDFSDSKAPNNTTTTQDESPSTNEEKTTDTTNTDSTTSESPTKNSDTQNIISADGHEYAISLPSLSNPGIFEEQNIEYNKIWIGEPPLTGGHEYIANLSLGPINIPEGQAISDAKLTWNVSGPQSAYKLVSFEIKAILDSNTSELNQNALPSAQTLTSNSTTVNTADWVGSHSTSYWVPTAEEIDLTNVIQEVTSHTSWANNQPVQIVMKPTSYPAGTGFVGFNSAEGSNAVPIFNYSTAPIGNVEITESNESTQSNSEPSIWDGYEPVINNLNWFVWRDTSLPNVTFNPNATNAAYRAVLTDNTDNKTLHFNQNQGRLDGTRVKFPFEVIVRNIGIRDINDEQSAPAINNQAYIFAGVQIHTLNSEDLNSMHVVVGHRGYSPFTVEGKTTLFGNSTVNDIGANQVPLARADIRIIGHEDGQIRIYWQQPNLSQNSSQDTWVSYNSSGILPGTMPNFGQEVVIGLITYGYFDQGVPFVGTADRIDIQEYQTINP